MLNYFTLTNLGTLIQQIIDILCVWAVVYYCLKIVKNNSRTIQIFKGILLIIIVKALASAFGLHTIENLAGSIMTWGVVAIIVIFQPEIRNILEKIGQTSVFSRISTLTINERENLVDELVKACSEMSKTKTGSLISIEQGHSLSDFIKTGTPMNSVVSSELLCSIFQYGTPLHDGAVIIQGVKIACAAAYFPPTTRELPTSYGARHRAAVGISEITDSITIVVSEETGNISIAQGGKLSVISETSLRAFLMDAVCSQQGKAKEKEAPRSEHSETVQEGKKPGVFAHYFKGKNKKANANEAKKYTKKKKEDATDIVQSEHVILDRKDKMKIEDLTEDREAPFDELFENIVEPEKKEEIEEGVVEIVEEPLKKRKRRTKAEIEAANAEEVQQQVAQNVKKQRKEELHAQQYSNMAKDLLSDVIEPDSIVLHYEKEDEDDSPKISEEGRKS